MSKTDVEDVPNDDPYALKNAPYLKPSKDYKYKEKVLVFANRGITNLGRQLLNDLKSLLPHHKAESKWEKRVSYAEINEICEISSCSSVVFIESKKNEMILWVAKSPYGPTLKARITNIHTLKDSTFFGNCLARSRPLLTFDKSFSELPHLKLIQTLFTQVFGTPNNHPKSMPFHDHCLSFFYLDNHIYMRHYQISPENEFSINNPDRQMLTEIGPQFALEVILLLNGSFNGITLWRNPNYLSPIVVSSTALNTLHKQMRKYKMNAEAERYKKRQKFKDVSPHVPAQVVSDETRRKGRERRSSIQRKCLCSSINRLTFVPFTLYTFYLLYSMAHTTKENRDVYYRKAKEDGYRARSAYKLLQIFKAHGIFYPLVDSNEAKAIILNHKCVFQGSRSVQCTSIGRIRNVIDLCAAPGSWSQLVRNLVNYDYLSFKTAVDSLDSGSICSRVRDYCNTKPVIVSIDLQEIAPINGVYTLKGDITDKKVLDQVRDLFVDNISKNIAKVSKDSNIEAGAQLITCDGAPDISGLHETDAFVQSALIRASLCVCCSILDANGTFVCKTFFNSTESPIFRQVSIFFDECTIFKPSASRMSSSEHFIVAKGFKPLGKLRAIKDPETSNFQENIPESLFLGPLMQCGDLSGYDKVIKLLE
ncbi:conserved hypothetical protein [Theileria equi strain WA]|uniref:Putative tRNA (cytidine(32)/guanosine(34)-2'-O)-methyltransferase n=1 Tax=Theileria equi strain WA TaxID=1537102 RepID=L1LEY9_THEEQ|nr:conserved hypothetical protein [Theileria equi strain WA]EKX73916.1 conserved hypothetical protein [Theileria equi strain WA]|eukprot:XP_004833368.1 conserved hypothetical protein [Theileria equi strain WA]